MPAKLNLTPEERAQRKKETDKRSYEKRRDRILAQKAEYYQQRREAILEKVHQYRAENPDKIRDAHRRYNTKHAEKVRAMWLKYAKEHAEEKRRATAQWRAANPERAKQNCLNWARNNRDKVRAAGRAAYARNPQAALIRWHNRRARIKAAGGTLSPDIAAQLYKKQNGLCACCGVPLGDAYHLDHIMPLALGGAHDDSNMQLLTPGCNLSKGAKHPDKYKELKESACRSRD